MQWTRVFTCICWLLLFKNRRTAAFTYSCPFNINQSVGYLEGNLCATFVQLQPPEALSRPDPNGVLNEECYKRFKRGYMSRLPNNNKILSLPQYYDNRYTYIGAALMQLIMEGKDAYFKVRYQFNDTNVAEEKIGRLHQILEMFQDDSRTNELVQDDFPKCIIYSIVNDELKGEIYPCKDIAAVVSGHTFQILCMHDKYRDCEEKDYPDQCTEYVGLHPNKGKWRGFHVVLRESEKPYGKACYTYAGGKEKCKDDCRGTWSEWSKPENGKCVYGASHFDSYRIRPKYDHQLPKCKADYLSDDCCVQVDRKLYSNCYDYDKDLSVLINATSCGTGTRIRGASGHYECVCKTGVRGLLCDDDPCGSYCFSGSTCIPPGRDGKITCICGPGRTGAQCKDKIEYCISGQRCMNGGTCEWEKVDQKQRSKCICASGFIGRLCQYKANFCTEDSCSGNGVCHNDTRTRSYRCICNKGYKGRDCEIEAGVATAFIEFFTGQSAPYVYIIVGLSVTLIIFSGGKTYVVHRRRRRARMSMSSLDSSIGGSIFSRFSTIGASRASTMRSTAGSKMDSRAGMNSRVSHKR